MFRKQHIFIRNKKPLLLKIQSVIDYCLGLSYRKIKNKLKFLYDVEVAISAIYRWIKSFQERIKLRIKPKEHTQIAADETVVKINGYRCFLWAAVDIHTKELVAFDASAGRSGLDAIVFLSKVKSGCTNNPILITDKGPWYSAAETIGLDKWHQTFGIRNAIERFFGLVKDRTRVFYNNINCSSVRQLELFMKMFAWYYMNIRRVIS